MLRPIEPQDPRNVDHFNRQGERIRVRVNGPGRDDLVVQDETPIVGLGHAVVRRSDRAHDPRYDRYDASGRKRTDQLPPGLSPGHVVSWAIADIKTNWRAMRRDFYEGLP